MSDSSLKLSIHVPSDWNFHPLEEICEVISRGKAPSYVEESSILAIGQRCVQDNGFDAYAARPHDPAKTKGLLFAQQGDILLNSTGTGTIGRSCVFREQGHYFVDGHVTLLRPKQEVSVSLWLRTLIQSPWGQNYLECKCYSGSTNQIELSRSKLAKSFFPFPAFQVQKKIAEVLNTVDDAIATTTAHVTKLKQAKAGLLHDLLTRGIDENGELRDPIRHPERFQDSKLGTIPKCWDISTVEFEFDVVTGFTLGQHRRPKSNPRKYLRVANVQRDRIVLDDILELEAHDNEFNVRKLKENDLLIVEGHANPLEIGRCAIVTGEIAAFNLTHQNHLFRLRAKSIHPQFALEWLNSSWARSYWNRVCGTSSGLNTINRKMLNALKVVLPARPEQEEIVKNIDTYKTKISLEHSQLQKLKLLKQGLTSDLLTGRVRVKLDSSEDA